MVCIRVVHVSASGVLGHNDHRDARAIAENIQRQHCAGVIVSAAFIKSDEECRLFRQLRMVFQSVHHALNQRFQNVEFGACRMSIAKAVRLQIGNCRQFATVQIAEEVCCVLDMRCAGLPMMDAAYWKGLQISQYQSPPVPMRTSTGSVDPLSSRAAALKPPP